MPTGEQDTIFTSKIKYGGFFNFANFYRFCYDWLIDEFGLDVTEDKYLEKLKGDEKEIEIEWTGEKKVTDYFKFKVGVKFRILGLKKVEIVQDGKKIKTNEGSVEIKIKSVLIRDYQGKYDKTAFLKFLRSIYEKWIIKSRIDEFEGKLFGDSEEFLGQAKAYLAVEGGR